MNKKKTLMILFLVMAVMAVCSVAFASNVDVPWNAPLERLVNALSSKTALLISCIGLFFAGGMLIFGGDLGTFGKSIFMVVLISSILGALMNVMSVFMTTQGALIS